MEKTKLENLKIKKDNFQNKIFWMMLETAVIFAIPAAVAFFGGKWLDSRYGSENRFLFIALATAFVFSWFLIIAKYRKLSREAKAIDQAIAKEKERLAKDKLNKTKD